MAAKPQMYLYARAIEYRLANSNKSLGHMLLSVVALLTYTSHNLIPGEPQNSMEGFCTPSSHVPRKEMEVRPRQRVPTW